MSEVPGAVTPTGAQTAAGPAMRPQARLPLPMLLQLSVYWLGITSIWAALGANALPSIVTEMQGEKFGPIWLGVLHAIGVAVAIVVQPVFGSISDFTVSRLGRRKPYILVGSILDVLFLVGIAFADRYGILLVFVVLLQFSSNMAQGPFQGYVPDLVPARQVSLASGLMGLMIVLGQAAGAGAVALSSWLYTAGIFELNGRYGLGIIGVGVFELATALATIILVREGRAPRARGSMSWLDVVRSTWATDILRERSYLWLLASRLLVLSAPAILFAVGKFFLQRSLLMSEAEASFWIFIVIALVGAMTAVAVLPGGLLSDRIGRKNVIWLSCAVGAVGMAVLAVAGSIELSLVATSLVGIGAGIFLAVDWALMTDIIPKASSGRYMGISNVATGLGSGIIPGLLGGVIVSGVSFATGNDTDPLGPRTAIAFALVLFALGGLALRPVDERRREDTVEPIPATLVPGMGVAPPASSANG